MSLHRPSDRPRAGRAGSYISALMLCLLWALAPQASADTGEPQNSAVARSGDILQWGIPLAGLGLSFLLADDATVDFDARALGVETDGPAQVPGLNWPGPRLGGSARHDFIVSFARMEITTYALKYSINAKRPNGSAQSFPSGHTAAAFMGAEYIRKHFGYGWGVPAYLTAGWVGYTRVESRNHYTRDVIAGALIGIASNYDFDSVKTPAGTLRFGPALLDRAPIYTGRDDPLDTRFDGDPLQAALPGLRLELRF